MIFAGAMTFRATNAHRFWWEQGLKRQKFIVGDERTMSFIAFGENQPLSLISTEGDEAHRLLIAHDEFSSLWWELKAMKIFKFVAQILRR